MTLVMGIDPGNNGALCTVDSLTGAIVSMENMPAWFMAVGKSKSRKRIDAVALADTMNYAKHVLGVELVVIEAVGGRPGQGASAGFTFGYGVGLLYMACIIERLPIETVPPATWKKLMRLPGKARKKKDSTEPEVSAKDADAAIIQRADELFPDDRNLWRGPRGGFLMDRAEAALLAKFGCDHVLRTVGTSVRYGTDAETRLAYRNADTGA